jgi:hypothetical protein
MIYAMPSSRGSSKPEDMFPGGIIYVDHVTGFVDVRHLISLNAAETIKSKLHYKKDAFHDGVKVQAYHTDNGVFISRENSLKSSSRLSRNLV